MNNSDALGWVIMLLVVGGSLGWLLQEIPGVIKAIIVLKYFSKKFKKEQEIKTGMYYRFKK